MPRRQLWLIAIFTTAGFLLLYQASSVTGLHPDEAWNFLRVDEIAHGARPVQGMNSYTGPGFQYVLWPIFALFGATISILRITSAFLGLGTLGLWMWLLSFADPRRPVGLRQGLLFATLPAFVLLSRFATEITTLVPFLCSLGLALFWRAQMLERWPLAVGAGLAFALAAYTHALAICFPAAVAIAYLVNTSKSDLRRKLPALGAMLGAFAAVFLGFAVLRFFKDPTSGGSRDALRGMASFIFTKDCWMDLRNLPSILTRLLDGSLLYRRFVGELSIPVWPWMSALAVIACGGLWLTRKEGSFRFGRFLLTLALVLPVATAMITPRYADRYFFFALLIVPAIIAIGLHGLAERFRIRPALVSGIVILVSAGNALMIWENYFAAFSMTGGGLGVFPMGDRLMETSDHFVSVQKLSEQLVREGVGQIVADEPIMLSLSYYSRREARSLGLKRAVVTYNGPNTWAGPVTTPPPVESFEEQGRRFVHRPDFDPHFKVYIEDEGAPGLAPLAR
jgi:4-amino-4-deoxy-L-arabinose transferase-like glycosyltransferase